MLVNCKIVLLPFFFSLYLSMQSGLKNSVIAAFKKVMFSCFSLDNITHRQNILIHAVQFFS